MSLQECFELFLRTKQTRCRPQTMKFYAWLCQNVSHLAEATGHLNTPVSTVSRVVLEQWVIGLYQRVTAGGIRDTTVKKMVKFLKQFFAYLADEGLIENDPAVKLKCRIAQPVETRPFTAAELAQLFAFEPRKPVEFRDRALWLLLLDTGARCKEAVSLRVSDWRGTVIRIRNGKGGRYREMGIGTRTAQALQTYVDHHRPQPPGDDYLFLTDTGGPMDTLRVNAQLKRWAKRVGVQKATPHRFRATFATRFVRNGGERDLIRLQALLGHSTLDMSRHYVKLAEAEEAVLTSSTASIVDELLAPPAADSLPPIPVPTTTFLPVDVAAAMQTLLHFMAASPHGQHLLGQMLAANSQPPNLVNTADSLSAISSIPGRSHRPQLRGADLQGRAEPHPKSPEPRSGNSRTNPKRKEVNIGDV
jgi:integrase/recombinase XerD